MSSLGDFSIMVSASMLYGAQVVLCILCVHILYTRKRTGYRWQLVSTTALFILSSCDVFVNLAYMYTSGYGPEGPDIEHQLDILDKVWIIMKVLSHVVADLILIYRCYLIWECRKLIIMTPVALLVGTAACGLSYGILPPAWPSTPLLVFWCLSLATNLIITFLSAGRIWWIGRKSARLLGTMVQNRYNTAINIILESGVFYSAVLLVIVITYPIYNQQSEILGVDDEDPSDLPQSYIRLSDTFYWFFQVSGLFSTIMPTLLLVRVGLGGGALGPTTADSRGIFSSTKEFVARTPASSKTSRSEIDFGHASSRQYGHV